MKQTPPKHLIPLDDSIFKDLYDVQDYFITKRDKCYICRSKYVKWAVHDLKKTGKEWSARCEKCGNEDSGTNKELNKAIRWYK